jgi:hypothetical protein
MEWILDLAGRKETVRVARAAEARPRRGSCEVLHNVFGIEAFQRLLILLGPDKPNSQTVVTKVPAERYLGDDSQSQVFDRKEAWKIGLDSKSRLWVLNGGGGKGPSKLYFVIIAAPPIADRRSDGRQWRGAGIIRRHGRAGKRIPREQRAELNWTSRAGLNRTGAENGMRCFGHRRGSLATDVWRRGRWGRRCYYSSGLYTLFSSVITSSIGVNPQTLGS